MQEDPTSEIFRCPWCGTDSMYIDYHDTVWGVPEFDDKALFAKLILDGAQAGLSWITILRRERGYREVFEGLDPERMVHFDEQKIQAALMDDRIIRNKLKVYSAISNARAYQTMKEAGLNFSDYLWDFVSGEPIQNSFTTMSEVPAATPLSETISKDLKKRGFNFVGPTIVYAFMQAVGMVNDHLVPCHRHEEVKLTT